MNDFFIHRKKQLHKLLSILAVRTVFQLPRIYLFMKIRHFAEMLCNLFPRYNFEILIDGLSVINIFAVLRHKNPVDRKSVV